ncbi:MAG TPA: hypothetical protein VOB72_21100 [Candidatus Dormibacteraeota bacterium]|nr:hypothetical protein [Candidatus Dormibacteraeota bacterium]
MAEAAGLIAAALPESPLGEGPRRADLGAARLAGGWSDGVRALRDGRSAMAAFQDRTGPALRDWTFLGDPGGDGLLESRRLPGGAWQARLRDLMPVAYLQLIGILAAGPDDETVVSARAVDAQRDVLAWWLEAGLLPLAGRAAVHVVDGPGIEEPWLRLQPAAVLARALTARAVVELTPLDAYLAGERGRPGRDWTLRRLRSRRLVSVFATAHHRALREAGVACLPGPLLAGFAARGFLHLLRDRGLVPAGVVPAGGLARSAADAHTLLAALSGSDRLPVFLKSGGLGGAGVVRARTVDDAARTVAPLLTLAELDRALLHRRRPGPGHFELEVAEDVRRRLPGRSLVEFNLQFAVQDRPAAVVPLALARRHQDGLAFSWGPAGNGLLGLVDRHLGGPLSAVAGALLAAGPAPHVLSIEGLASRDGRLCLVESNLRVGGPAQLAMVRERLGPRLDAEAGAAYRVFNLPLRPGGPGLYRQLDDECRRLGCRCVPLGRETPRTVKVLVLARRAAGSRAACAAAVRRLRGLVR